MSISSKNSVEKTTPEDLLKLTEECYERLRAGELYNLRNDAKLRAVYNTQSYDEFKYVFL